jgi:predicted TIM-barrel fold metal-dependent hydrolase
VAIDFHAHWIPPRLAQLLRERREVPRVEGAAGGEHLASWVGRRPLAPLLGLPARLHALADHGIEIQVLSLAGLFGIDCLPAAESLPLVAAFNDAAAAACTEHPGRVAALAALPLADAHAAQRELERAHTSGLAGAILPADGFATRQAAEQFRPLFETGNRLGCHFYVHPGPLTPQPARDLRAASEDSAWLRHIVLAVQARLSEATLTLCLSGFLDAYPWVTVQVANLGGAVPFLRERMEQVTQEPLAGLSRCYVDTASFGPRGIELAVACFGADRVLLGTDCPILATGSAVRAWRKARLDGESRDLVARRNALRLLRR